MGHSAEFKMLVPKKDRLTIYRYLFKEGVMVAKKDCNKPKHDDPELPVKNIYVIKLLTSLKSRGYVTEKFSWQWYYWYLTKRVSSTSASTCTSLPRLCQRPSRRPPAQLLTALPATSVVVVARVATGAARVAATMATAVGALVTPVARAATSEARAVSAVVVALDFNSGIEK